MDEVLGKLSVTKLSDGRTYLRVDQTAALLRATAASWAEHSRNEPVWQPRGREPVRLDADTVAYLAEVLVGLADQIDVHSIAAAHP